MKEADSMLTCVTQRINEFLVAIATLKKTKLSYSVIDFEHYNGIVFIYVNFKRIPSIFSQNTSDVSCVICKIKGTKCSDFLIANRLWAERCA